MESGVVFFWMTGIFWSSIFWVFKGVGDFQPWKVSIVTNEVFGSPRW